MRVLTSSEGFSRWARGAGLLMLVGVAWAFLAPVGAFWSAILMAGLLGSVVATTLLVRSRSVPSLAQVIATAQAEPVVVPALIGLWGKAGLRPRGERKQ